MINYLRASRLLKGVARCLALSMLLQIALPTYTYALADAEQIDFAGFEPVGTTDMVNLFNGDFNYNLPVLNIPGPDGGGYAMSLSYHSGVQPEEDASWVGYGWSLNPGILNRNKIGFADDFNGVSVETFNKNKPNWTVGAVADLELEYHSVDKEKEDPSEKKGKLYSKKFETSENKKEKKPKKEAANALGNNNISVSLSKSARLNNYRGFHSSYGFGAGYGGYANVNTNFSRQGATFDLTINFERILNARKRNRQIDNKEKNQEGYKGLNFLRKRGTRSLLTYSVSSFSAPEIPFDVESYAGMVYKRSLNLQANIGKNFGAEVGYSGSFNYQLPFFYKEQEAYGYLHNQKYEDINDNKKEIKDGLWKMHYGKRLGDYSLERESSVNALDKYLGIPYATPDQFVTTGEVAMGGFKARSKTPGHFYPAPVMSQQQIRTGGMEVGISVSGEHVGIGFDIDLGSQFSSLAPWESRKEDKDDDGYPFDFDGSTYFRFNGDPAGELRYSNLYHTDSGYRESADLSGNSVSVGLKRSKPEVGGLNMQKDAFEAARQSIISYHTFEDTDNFDKNTRTQAFITQIKNEYGTNDTKGKLIREFQITTADNRTVTYGIPVMSANETSLAIGMPDPAPADIDNNYIIYKDDVKMDDDILLNQYVSGSRTKHHYASAFLMTQVTNAAYVDLTGDGPTEDDFGGWTRFDYRQWERKNSQEHTGSTGDKYNYRTPYKGYMYNQGNISLSDDDRGTVSRGQKEIYYLMGVETKTHYAFFVTNKSVIADFEELDFVSTLSTEDKEKLSRFVSGSGKVRLDGLGAPDLNGTVDPAGARDYSTVNNNQEVEYLEKIVLVSKDRPVKPLEITRFSYDYSMCPGIPNAKAGSGGPTGKLTLRKVWTEHEGTVRSRIAPYVFDYAYPSGLASRLRPELRSKYADILVDMNKVGVENPAYAPEQLDAWGNYRDRGKQLADNRFDWTPQDPSATFDPAAWHLKQINLPSGGKIIVQYEQNDYAYVQDKKANIMLPLKRIHSNDIGRNDENDSEVNKYVLDVERSGMFADIDASNELGTAEKTALKTARLKEYATELEEYFSGGEDSKGPNEYIYFKFLYGMEGAAGLDTRSEYISGYTTVKKVVADPNQPRLHITLGDREDWEKDRKLAKQDVWILPKDVCYYEYVTSKSGLYDSDIQKIRNKLDNDIWSAVNSDNVEKLKKNYELVTDGNNSRKELRKNLRGGMEDLGKKELFRSVKSRDKVCQNLDYEHSYFRVPVWKKKLGGGCRVKRLLMYDPGLDTDDQSLYGTEYQYRTTEGITSGVATMEPAVGREENPLVSLLDRGNQSFFRRAIFGNERQQLEGPIGETLYPAASVGYSRVVVQNIQKGATGTGYQVHEYHTCKDFPFKVLNEGPTTMDKKNRTRDWMSVSLGMISIDIRKMWVSQGYGMVTNQMHGTQKRQATYRGDFKPGETDNVDLLVSSVEYEYFNFGSGDKLNVLKAERAPDKDIILSTYESIPGIEEEVAMYAKEIISQTLDLSMEIDFLVDWQSAPVITVYLDSWGVGLNYELNTSGTHVTGKVMHLPTVVKKVSSYSQGVTTVTENKIFDKYSRNPLVTVTYDLYNDVRFTGGKVNKGAYYTYNIPAYLIYPGMDNRSVKSDGTHQITELAGSLTTYGENPEDANTLIKKILSEKGFNLNEASIQGIVSASAGVYENNWFDSKKSSAAVLDEYLTKSGKAGDVDKEPIRNQVNKLYRPVTSYTFGGGQLRQASSDEGLIFRDGPAEKASFFDWNATGLKDAKGRYKDRNSDDWLRGPQVMRMSPHGYPVEEQNILDIPSAVRFGYRGNILPVISAQNASYESIFFKDFEFETNETFARVLDKSSHHAHSGNTSLILSSFVGKEIISTADGLKVTDQLRKEGILVRMWVKASDRAGNLTELREGDLQARVSGSAAAASFRKIARAGSWDLIEAGIDLSRAEAGTELFLKIDTKTEDGITIYADDIKMQPTYAEVSCNVYDVTSLRLLTQFNDQHFGVYYVYDNEARLQRKMIETERGMKMLQEQVTNQKRVSRNE
jgi:hypothetical protein